MGGSRVVLRTEQVTVAVRPGGPLARELSVVDSVEIAPEISTETFLCSHGDAGDARSRRARVLCSAMGCDTRDTRMCGAVSARRAATVIRHTTLHVHVKL